MDSTIRKKVENVEGAAEREYSAAPFPAQARIAIAFSYLPCYNFRENIAADPEVRTDTEGLRQNENKNILRDRKMRKRCPEGEERKQRKNETGF